MKNCGNCKHWQDIKKTQEVKYSYEIKKAVIYRVGICLLDNTYTTEKYLCIKLNCQGNVIPLNYEAKK